MERAGPATGEQGGGCKVHSQFKDRPRGLMGSHENQGMVWCSRERGPWWPEGSTCSQGWGPPAPCPAPVLPPFPLRDRCRSSQRARPAGAPGRESRVLAFPPHTLCLLVSEVSPEGASWSQGGGAVVHLLDTRGSRPQVKTITGRGHGWGASRRRDVEGGFRWPADGVTVPAALGAWSLSKVYTDAGAACRLSDI